MKELLKTYYVFVRDKNQKADGPQKERQTNSKHE